MDRLAELEVLVAIADAGTLAAAARKLGRSTPAVTRILAGLEARIGVTLVERAPRGSRLTDSGKGLLERARIVLNAYGDAVEDAGGAAAAARGHLKVTAPLVFGRDHVAPLVGAFLDRQPLIHIELMLADRMVDLVDEQVDLAVRIGPVTDGNLIVRRIGTVRRVTVASPDYLSRRGRPVIPEDVVGHDAIQSECAGLSVPWTYRRGTEAVRIPIEPRLSINQADAAIAAALEGRGLLTALSYQVDGLCAAGRLEGLLDGFEPPPIPVQLVYTEGRRSLRRLRLLIDFLAEHLRALTVLDH